MNKETNTSIFDVAKYIIQVFYPDNRPIDQITLYKLLWFCQGWHYYIKGGPLFPEEFDARKLGPVPMAMWADLGGSHPVNKKIVKEKGNVDNINDFTKKVIRRKAGIYSQFDSRTLSEMSYRCVPWDKYIKMEGKTIPNDELGEYFIKRGKEHGLRRIY